MEEPPIKMMFIRNIVEEKKKDIFLLLNFKNYKVSKIKSNDKKFYGNLLFNLFI